MDRVLSVGLPRYTWAAVFFISLLLAVLVAGLIYKSQLSSYQQRFAIEAETGIQHIVQKLSAADAMLDALVGLHQAGDEMDPYLFTPFSEKILEEYSFIESIQYLSYISKQEKQQFVEEMKALGFTQFNIHTLGSKPPVIAQENFMVTSFIEPLSPRSAKFMGLDWTGSHAIQDGIENAVNQNGIVMIKAPGFLKRPDHYLLLSPTYFGRSIPEEPVLRIQQLSGLFLILIDWQALTSTINPPQTKGHAIDFELLVHNGSYAHENELPDDSSMDMVFYKQNHLKIGSSEIDINAMSASVYQRRDLVQLLGWVGLTLCLYVMMVFIARSRYLDKQDKYNVHLQLIKEQEQAAVTLGAIGDAVISLDTKYEIKYMNPVAAKMCQIDVLKAIGKSINQLVNLVDLSTNQLISDPIEYYLDRTQGRHPVSGSDVALNVEGSFVSVDGNVSPLIDVDDELIGFVLVLRDVSLERQLTNELVYQASHDALTGLVNRLEFENKLREVLEISRQQDTESALCYLDMDQFKLINDTCGHMAGDELLKQVSGLLLVQMREEDLVARLGGDEFGILINKCELKIAQEIAERIRHTLNDYHFTWEDQIFNVSASIGLVMINHDSGNLSDLLSSADLACYAAKDAGRNVVHTYRADDEEIAQKFSQMQWLPRIKKGLRENEFELAVQSIASIKADASPATICEFLLRWPQSDGSFISPAIIIPTAERYDLMRELDRWIIEQALRVIPELDQRVAPPGSQMYTINLSGQSIGDSGLSDYIWQQMVENKVNPELICFEITETVAIANFSVACDFINQLREKGCRFALDDFGSGLSSFGYLKRLPLDFLKIDGLFVRDMLNDPVDLAMVRTIHDVARVLKLETIAEWVEDKEVYQALKEIGVDYAQGFYLNKPQMVKDLLSQSVLDIPRTEVHL